MPRDPYRYFRVEARELIAGLHQGILELERGEAKKEVLSRLMRLAHTLKGAARVVRLGAVAEMAHSLEDALAPHRDTDGPVTSQEIGSWLARVDGIATQVSVLTVSPDKPAAAELPPDDTLDTTRVPLDELDGLLQGLTSMSVQVAAVRHEMEGLERSRRLARVLAETLAQKSTSPLLSAEQRGSIMRWGTIAQDLRDSLDGLELRLTPLLDNVERDRGGAREAAERLRLLPAGAIFGPLERAARDTARSLNKRIQFLATGGEIRMDGHVVAAVRDALLHGVRNAVAHGIEAEDLRIASGKAPVGRIHLQVERRERRVVFRCQDDGRGIEPEAVRFAAQQRGLLSPGVSALTLKQATDLLLRGGLSTTAFVTEIAGRGVGLDVVREVTARLKGEAHLRTDPGRGTTLEIVVPMSLSSIAVLRVQAEDVTVALPLDGVRAVLHLSERDVLRTQQSDCVRFADEALPLLSLARLLEQPAARPVLRRMYPVVVVEARPASASAREMISDRDERDGPSTRLALSVDRLLGIADIVVSPLPAAAGPCPLIAGAAFDSEGNPQLVLDVRAVAGCLRSHRESSGEAVTGSPPEVLVIDDSLTTRMLEQSILDSAGYDVVLACSGEEGLEKARIRPPSVALVDIEMPGMDGFAFLEQWRADASLRHVPTILVSSRTGAGDIARGRELGASAYIVKSEFDQAHLLDTVRHLVGSEALVGRR